MYTRVYTHIYIYIYIYIRIRIRIREYPRTLMYTVYSLTNINICCYNLTYFVSFFIYNNLPTLIHSDTVVVQTDIRLPLLVSIR